MFLTEAFQQSAIRVHWSISYSKFPYGATLARIEECGLQVLELIRLMLCSVYCSYSQCSPALCESQLQGCLQILNFHFHVKQIVQPGNLRSCWSTLATSDSIWHGRGFMTQATYYAKYLFFSTYTSVQFGLMIGITTDYGPINIVLPWNRRYSAL